MMHVGIANPRWWGKRSRHSRRMRNQQFYVAGKRPMTILEFQCRDPPFLVWVFIAVVVNICILQLTVLSSQTIPFKVYYQLKWRNGNVIALYIRHVWAGFWHGLGLYAKLACQTHTRWRYWYFRWCWVARLVRNFCNHDSIFFNKIYSSEYGISHSYFSPILTKRYYKHAMIVRPH